MRARALGAAAAGLAAIWIAGSGYVAHRLTARAAPMRPERLPEVGWARFAAHRLAASDGTEVGAWASRGEPGAPVVVLVHGNGGSRTHDLQVGRTWAEMGCSLVLLTVRAHGDSGGEVNDVGFGARHDVVAAVELARRLDPGAPVIVHGASLGAAAATFAAAELGERVAAYVLEAPYRDLHSAVRLRTEIYLPPVLDAIAYYGLIAAAGVLLPHHDRIRPIDHVADIPESVPVLIVAGGADRRAPLSHARALFERVSSHATLAVSEGATHVTMRTHAPAEYAAALRGFLAKVQRAPPELEDGERREVLNGVSQWWRVSGARHRTTPLVAVHGGPGGNHWSFERSAGLGLERSRTVVHWEQRGSGRSNAPADEDAYSMPILVADLEALRVVLGAARIDVLGYSFGATLAAEYALAHPDRLRKLVLQAPAELGSDRLARTQLQGFLAVAQGNLREELAAIARGDGTPSEALERVWLTADGPTVDRFLFQDQEKARWNRDQWAASGLTNTGRMLEALLRASPPPILPRAHAISAPALLIVGRYDRNVGVDYVRDLAAAIPGARLEVFEHSAHFPDIEETDRWVRSVEEHLTR